MKRIELPSSRSSPAASAFSTPPSPWSSAAERIGAERSDPDAAAIKMTLCDASSSRSRRLSNNRDQSSAPVNVAASLTKAFVPGTIIACGNCTSASGFPSAVRAISDRICGARSGALKRRSASDSSVESGAMSTTVNDASSQSSLVGRFPKSYESVLLTDELRKECSLTTQRRANAHRRRRQRRAALSGRGCSASTWLPSPWRRDHRPIVH